MKRSRKVVSLKSGGGLTGRGGGSGLGVATLEESVQLRGERGVFFRALVAVVLDVPQEATDRVDHLQQHPIGPVELVAGVHEDQRPMRRDSGRGRTHGRDVMARRARTYASAHV